MKLHELLEEKCYTLKSRVANGEVTLRYAGEGKCDFTLDNNSALTEMDFDALDEFVEEIIDFKKDLLRELK